MLSIADLSFAYPGMAPLFTGLNIEVGGGDVLAVVGANGAGKSTLLRLMNGLLRPAGGRIAVNGLPIAGLKVHEIAVHVGTLFQTPEQQLFAATVADEVAFGPRQLRLPEAEVEGRVSAAMDRAGVSERAARHPLDLDNAARRFVALASVLAMTPNVLLLDEPQRGLDRGWTERLERIIGQERRRGGTVVLICHDMDFVERNAQSVLALGVDAPRQRPTRAFFGDRELVARASLEQPASSLLADLLRQSPEPGRGGAG